ncbi:hypothetical protein HGG75_24615 [Ochrobactrum pseudogrignonense]|nr:hypothetical protein [Brucella pseudogrignonensis]
MHLRENLSARSIELQYALSELDALSAQPALRSKIEYGTLHHALKQQRRS